MRVGTALTDEVARIMPGLDARWDSSTRRQPAWFEAEADQLATLHAHWARRHPEAGAHFAALRGWALWVWKPVCFMVLSTHLAPAPFAAGQVSQGLAQAQVHALLLHAPALDTAAGDPPGPDAVDQAALLWRGALHAAWQRWQSVSGLGQKAAQAVVRDLVLASVACLCHGQEGARRRAESLARQWTAALGLPSRAFFIEPAAGSDAPLVVKRAVCCLEWRCAGGITCAGCPRRHLAQGGLKAG